MSWLPIFYFAANPSDEIIILFCIYPAANPYDEIIILFCIYPVPCLASPIFYFIYLFIILIDQDKDDQVGG